MDMIVTHIIEDFVTINNVFLLSTLLFECISDSGVVSESIKHCLDAPSLIIINIEHDNGGYTSIIKHLEGNCTLVYS